MSDWDQVWSDLYPERVCSDLGLSFYETQQPSRPYLSGMNVFLRFLLLCRSEENCSYADTFCIARRRRLTDATAMELTTSIANSKYRVILEPDKVKWFSVPSEKGHRYRFRCSIIRTWQVCWYRGSSALVLRSLRKLSKARSEEDLDGACSLARRKIFCTQTELLFWFIQHCCIDYSKWSPNKWLTSRRTNKGNSGM